MEAGRLVKITYLGLQPWVSLRIPCGKCFFMARGSHKGIKIGWKGRLKRQVGRS